MGPTVVLVLGSAVDFCVYFVNVRCADEYVIVLGNLRSAVCVFVRLCFDSTIHYFTHCFLLFHVGIVNTIILVILFCLVFWLANCSPQDPHHPELSGSKDRVAASLPCWVSDPRAHHEKDPQHSLSRKLGTP